MTTPTVPAAGDLGFSYEYAIAIDQNYQAGGSPDWWDLSFITNVQVNMTKKMVDAAMYRDKGAENQEVVGDNWSVTFDHQIQRGVNGLYIPTLQTLIDASGFGTRHKGSQVHIQFYDSEGADEAYEGIGTIQRTRGATGNADPGLISFEITGKGNLAKITNPVAQPLPVTPLILSVLPSGQGVGDLVTIKGQRFTGATDVEFDSTPATQFAVSDESTIVAELPAGSAGAVDVEVTTGGGVSNAFSYTRAV